MNLIDYRSLLQDAWLEMRHMRTELETLTQAKSEAKSESIALVGMDCRFPGGANSPEAYWELLRNGVDAITEVPPDRWDLSAYYDANPETPGKMYTRYGGFLDQVDQFDPQFFGISPREAINLDPQQRLLLEVSYTALERAGQSPDSLRGSSTGVFIGISFDDYAKRSLHSGDLTRIDAYSSLGNTRSIAVGRIAYVLGLQGPVIQLDTTCSSSLLAVHLACQSLRSGECDLALAGGVSLMLAPDVTIGFCKLKALSADGRCKTFDANANGYSRGEGCGIVVLKRLADAVANKDNILAVIRGSAVNHDGQSNGLTAPNGAAQEAVIRQALVNAGIQPNQLQYVETHGTGTSLGDPIEVLALANALGEERSPERPLQIGSVKTNFGHLEAAAGVASLIKVVLALQHQQIPPHLHFHQPNPYIPWSRLPVKVSTQLIPWNTSGERLAGISSFGMSGTNVHLIVQERTQGETQKETQKETQNQTTEILHRPYVLTLSAKSKAALQTLAQRYLAFFNTSPDCSLSNLCFTANTGRSHFEYRLAFITTSLAQLQQNLAHFINDQESPGTFTGRVPSSSVKIAFMFTGQGSQYVRMGWQLYQTQSTFRQTIDRCAELLQPSLDLPLLKVLYPDAESENNLLHQTRYTQPALFAIEYALYQLWRSWGIQPEVVMGHSIGEYVAACVAGVFSLEDALKLVAARARLMQTLPANGRMTAVMADEVTVQQYLQHYVQQYGGDQIAIAAVNAPDNTVISGERIAVSRVIAALTAQGIKSTPLPVSHAFHSPLMQSMLLEFQQIAATVKYAPPRLKLISNVTGTLITDSIAAPDYWCQHILKPVRFADGMQTLAHLNCTAFLEVGAKPTLLSLGRTCLPTSTALWLPSLRPSLPQVPMSDWQTLLSSLAQLYTQNAVVNWVELEQSEERQRIVLPTYPFQRQRYWMDVPSPQPQSSNSHPLLGQVLSLAKLETIHFQNQLRLNAPAFLQHHRILGQPIMPAAGLVEMALVAGAEGLKGQLEILNLVIQRSLPLQNEPFVQIVLTPNREGYRFEIFSTSETKNTHHKQWTLYADGEVRATDLQQEIVIDLQSKQNQCSEAIDIAQFYQACYEHGIEYGSDFQAIGQLWRGEQQALGHIRLPQHLIASVSSYHLHPVILDAALQIIGATLPTAQPYLPVSIDRFTYHRPASETIWSYAQLRSNLHSIPVVDVQLINADGSLIATLEGLRLQPVGQSSDSQDWLYQVEWRLQPLELPYLLSPVEVRDRVMPQLSELTAQPERFAYGQQLSQLEDLSLNYVIRAFEELGWSFSLGQQFSIADVTQQFGVIESHQRLLNRLLEILTEAGILRQQGEQWEVLQTLPPAMTRLETLQPYLFAQAELKLLHRCGSQLASVLQGKIDPLNLLFPDGDLTIITPLYQDSVGAKLMNATVQQAVKTAVSQKPTGSTLRVLEIGAGTGGTTTYLLPILDAATTKYVFTDISSLFTAKAQEKFKEYSFVEYRTLDITRSPQSQSYSLQCYDIIIAANVLHATPDLQQSLTHVQQLLTPGGILLLLEGVQPMRWLDLIFGLTEGWWCFTDARSYPLLTGEQWQQLLQNCGFASVSAIVPQLNQFALQAVILGQIAGQIAGQIIATSQWLIFADRQGIGERLAVQLRARGHSVSLAFSGERYQQIGEFQHQLNPLHKTDCQRLLEQVTPDERLNVVYLWSLDCSESNTLSAERLQSDTQWLCNSVLHLIQTLVARPATQLWLVTQAAVSTGDSTALPAIVQSPIWGLGKVIGLEHPEFHCRCLDLDPAAAPIEQANTLFTELTAPIEETQPETQIAWRQQNRYVARLVRYQAVENHQLVISQRGTLENLSWQAVSRRSPHPNEVDIRVYAAGLNFRDVLNALDLYPGEAGLLGCECVGEVVAIGAEVNHFKVGDLVIAIASSSFSEYVTIDAAMVAHKPIHLSLEAAATIPVAFLTAFYSLYQLANIHAGERVLIHAGAGGVGHAAIQLAQQAGAEIFATASSDKWDTLRAIGVQHILNSRSLDFVEQIRRETNGEGVDIVLNSLSGDFVATSLSVLKPCGRFIELGKGKQPPLPDGIAYFPVDLVELCQQQPDLIQSMLQTIVRRFESGILQPLPQTLFSIQEAVHAFRMMQQAKHTGKIVLIQPSFEWTGLTNRGAKHLTTAVNQQKSDKRSLDKLIRSDATYLITGGLGGLGLLTAEWLVQQGATHLVLVSRHERSEIQPRILALEQTGAQIVVASVDVTQHAAMADLISHITNAMPPIRGVIHAAGVLEDKVLQQMTAAQMAKVMQPKVMGAWHLHELTQTQPIDFFVLFSSATALLGSPGQANHVAANTFLDTLAQYRRSLGHPALSINWGIWSEVGSAVDRATPMGLRGIGTIASQQGIQILAQLLQQPITQIGVVPIHWQQFLQQGVTAPFFEDFAVITQPNLQQSSAIPEFLQQFQSASPPKRRSLLAQYLRNQLAQVLGFSPEAPEAIDPQRGFFDLGMDSLTAVELRNRLHTSLNCSLPATIIFDYPTLNNLVDYLMQQLTLQANNDDANLPLSDLSEDELADLLEQELSFLEQEK